MPTDKLLPILMDHFGESEGKALMEQAEAVYQSLLPLAETETRGRKKNMTENIFPFAALYRALLAGGMTREDAMKHMYAISEVYTRRHGMRKIYEAAGKLPFFFSLFRKMFSTGLKGDSWEVEWSANDSERFIYRIKKCLWWDVCNQLDCPELCGIFCRNDDINFTDVTPRLHFKRSTTLGGGGPCCDFHFYRHEPPADWEKE